MRHHRGPPFAPSLSKGQGDKAWEVTCIKQVARVCWAGRGSRDRRGSRGGTPTGLRLDPRTSALLHAPIVPLLLRMAWPNVVVMLAQASSGLIETFWVRRLGTDALAGMALVFPGVMLMQMISAGSLGGGISSAIARALGSRRADDADALVLHALVINAALGALASVLVLVFGPELYRALGGRGASLDAALRYSNVVFAGNVLLWLMNALASAVRGTGNMLVPALVICGCTVILVPLSPLLIFGIGPFPALGIAGGGVAMLISFAVGAVALAWYVLAGRSVVRVRSARLQRRFFNAILCVGAVATVSTLQTNVTIGVATALVATAAGPAGVAGYGTGARLEYLLIPLVFGLGAPLVALVGTNIGAGQGDRALRIALVGGAIAFAMTEAIGVAAAVWPRAWLGLFGHDPGDARDRLGVSACCGTVLRFLRLGSRAVFRVAGSGPAALAAVRRLPAHARRAGRRLARAARDRLAAVAVRRAGPGDAALRRLGDRFGDVGLAGRPAPRGRATGRPGQLNPAANLTGLACTYVEIAIPFLFLAASSGCRSRPAARARAMRAAPRAARAPAAQEQAARVAQPDRQRPPGPHPPPTVRLLQRTPPPLALTLAAVAASRLGLEQHEPDIARAFVPAVAAMDDADRAYRRAIETTLPPDASASMLSAMASFRARAHDVRENARREIGELYRKYGRDYGWFDPLDVYLPPTTGLSHADGTRVATLSDAARSEVDTLRARVNDVVTKRLEPAQLEALIAAKKRRGEAFERALEAALAAAVAKHAAVPATTIDKIVDQLVRLADGWY